MPPGRPGTGCRPRSQPFRGNSTVSNPTLIGNVIFILLKNPAGTLPFFVK